MKLLIDIFWAALTAGVVAGIIYAIKFGFEKINAESAEVVDDPNRAPF